MDSSLSPAPHFPAPGSQLGPWLLLELSSSGAFGLVFRVQLAAHPERGPFALKLATAVEDPRFPREVALLQRLHHPSAPRFESCGQYTSPSGALFPFIVMQWVDGLPLYRWARGRSSAQVLQVLHQLAGAVAEAHALGGLHRDIKGDNILVTPEGRAVLLDWGAGSHRGARPVTDSVLPPGTASYRSPEAVRWSWAHRSDGAPYRAGPEDDVYALGVTAYRLCTGFYPPLPEEHSGRSTRLLAPSELATVSSGLNCLLLSCLSEDRHARPTASFLTTAFQAAAAEPDASLPISPDPSVATTEKTRNPGPKPRSTLPAWAAWAAASLVGGLVVLAGSRSPSTASSSATLRAAPLLDTSEAGLAHLLWAKAQNLPRAGVPTSALGLPMPKDAFPGQKKPPCDPDTQRVILGACWFVGARKPPCGKAAFDYEDGCYVPLFDAPRGPTATPP